MGAERAYIVDFDMITPYGRGIDKFWDGLMSKESAIRKLSRFDTSQMQSDQAGLVEGLVYGGEKSLVMQMIESVLEGRSVPPDADLLLATTKGEIDLLERWVLESNGNGMADMNGSEELLSKAVRLSGAGGRAALLSAACASSTVALSRAASMVRSGESACVLVLACDAVTEFVYSGFSSLMALDEEKARPFDSNRKGLSVGEATAFALLMSGKRAKREGRDLLGEVAGWGMTSDANHMTGPLIDGSGQARAIQKAISSAGIGISDVVSISAHGTGTVYNDSMEMKAIKAVFGESRVPVYSVKGGIGHSMGAAGILEALVSIRSLNEGVAPPTVNLRNVDEEAEGWVFATERNIDKDKAALSINSGFGGINSALILSLANGAQS